MDRESRPHLRAIAATGLLAIAALLLVPAPVLARHAASAPVAVKRIDINSAGRAELKTLPGIGDAEADRIIACRPYLTKTELVSKKVLPTGPYITIKNRVFAMQKGKPKVSATAPGGACG